MRRAVQAVLIALAVGATTTTTAQAQRPRYAQPFTPTWAAPQLGADPPAARPGGIVRIYGTRFRPEVRAYYGNQPMRVLEVTDRYITVEIPPNVRHDDYIYLVDRTGRARTAEPFAVVRRDRHRRWWR